MLVHHYPHLPPSLGALAATTGSFDGVHRGHVAVLQTLLRVASERCLPSCAVTYEPHPRIALGKEPDLHLLCSSREKLRLLASQGVDHAVVIPFTQALAGMSPDDFFASYLVNALHTQALVVGFDHSMGKGTSANFEKIRAMGNRHGVAVHVVNPYLRGDLKVSATQIRTALQQGDVAAANDMLGYPYAISGEVVKGRQIGRTIGYPTANIRLDFAQKVLPKDGAYAVHVLLNGKRYGGMLNVSMGALNHEGALCVEVHMFNFSAEIYGSTLTICLVGRLRNVAPMPSLDALKAQLGRDALQAKQLLPDTLR
ncbi:MAG: riboflavin biosynthesis protein RibF [Prevotellaceae bacterium]|nr:riboflavin biosynthesis protein RibF [Prevotellaceae bacterium]